jgi:hypothetical protein
LKKRSQPCAKYSHIIVGTLLGYGWVARIWSL